MVIGIVVWFVELLVQWQLVTSGSGGLSLSFEFLI